MKQNERILVYLVTGFLAVILVVAVMFGRDGNPADNASASSTTGLDKILGQKPKDEGKSGTAESANDPRSAAGLATPDQVVGQQPLVASKPDFAAGQVQQQLGQSRRDRTVRFVRARDGDSLDTLVRRWCGARDPFLDEAKSLNEDLVVLRRGQEVAVPWVDDDIVLAALEARQPKKPTVGGPDDPLAVPGSGLGSGVRPVATNATTHLDPDGPQARPSFAEPGDGTAVPATAGSSGVRPDAANSKPYTVKAGDSLWKIAARLTTKNKVDRMIAVIRQLNPGLGDTLRAGQTLLVPPAEDAAPAPAAPLATPTGA